MATVLAIAGKINSGKSTIGSILAKLAARPYVSFGEYVRFITRQRELPDVRESWQKVGAELVETDPELFCRAVLAQAEWKPGQALVIDGIRHAKIDDILRKLVAPSNYKLTFLEVNEQTRQERLRKEGIDAELSERIESHSTEQQVATTLREKADYIINGNEPLHLLLEKLQIISSDAPHEAVVSTTVLQASEIVNAVRNLSRPEQREVLARLLTEQASRNREVWQTVRFSSSMRVVAYSPEQEPHLAALRELLQHGAFVRLDNESDGTYEVFGLNRTYYVTMTPSREFAALLSSWTLDAPPREVILEDAE